MAPRSIQRTFVFTRYAPAMKLPKRALVFLAGAVTLLALTAGACDKATEPFADAPIDHHNTSPAVVYDMPDGFSNVAAKCAEHGHLRVFTAYHGDANRAAIAVVPDQDCP